MAFQAVPNTVQIEFRYRSITVPWVNTVYARSPLPYDAAAIDDLADAVELWAETGVIEQLSTGAAYTGLEVRGLSNEFDITATRTPVPQVAGLVNAPVLPVNVAFVVKFDAGLTGRSTRGRNYVGGLADTDVDSRLIGAVRADAIVDKYETLKATIFAAGWSMVIVSRYHNGAKRITAETFPVVNISYTDLQVDTRRSRLNNA